MSQNSQQCLEYLETKKRQVDALAQTKSRDMGNMSRHLSELHRESATLATIIATMKGYGANHNSYAQQPPQSTHSTFAPLGPTPNWQTQASTSQSETSSGGAYQPYDHGFQQQNYQQHQPSHRPQNPAAIQATSNNSHNYNQPQSINYNTNMMTDQNSTPAFSLSTRRNGNANPPACSVPNAPPAPTMNISRNQYF